MLSPGGCVDEQGDEDEDSDSSSSSHESFKYTGNKELNDFYQGLKNEIFLKKSTEKCVNEKNQILCTTSSEYTSNSNDASSQVSTYKSADWIGIFQKSLKLDSNKSNLYNLFIKSVRYDPQYKGLCLQPLNENTTSTHISALPFELLLRIVRWTIGSHLDIRVLGTLACVCRGFYLLANDTSIWRDICFKLWPIWITYDITCNNNNNNDNNSNNNNLVSNHQVTTSPSLQHYTSWREMAIYRPRVLFHGCYLCRVTYVRMGEAEIGSSYRPVFEVVYYRGIRFHASSNQISMFTAPSDPSSIVAVLSKSSNQATVATDTSLAENNNNNSGSNNNNNSIGNNNSTCQSVIKAASSCGTLLEGTYEWCDHDSIICTLHQLTDKENQPPMRRRRCLGPVIPQLTVTFTIILTSMEALSLTGEQVHAHPDEEFQTRRNAHS
uniref:F-box domain-containing protein n=1 Tax=Trichobilharzia regenti TaxID=157069 RepID=A0AA85IUP4_TRIRE|nr:unnamed protein product [Trichobilharzia regenti]